MSDKKKWEIKGDKLRRKDVVLSGIEVTLNAPYGDLKSFIQNLKEDAVACTLNNILDGFLSEGMSLIWFNAIQKGQQLRLYVNGELEFEIDETKYIDQTAKNGYPVFNAGLFVQDALAGKFKKDNGSRGNSIEIIKKDVDIKNINEKKEIRTFFDEVQDKNFNIDEIKEIVKKIDNDVVIDIESIIKEGSFFVFALGSRKKIVDALNKYFQPFFQEKEGEKTEVCRFADNRRIEFSEPSLLLLKKSLGNENKEEDKVKGITDLFKKIEIKDINENEKDKKNTLNFTN